MLEKMIIFMSFLLMNFNYYEIYKFDNLDKIFKYSFLNYLIQFKHIWDCCAIQEIRNSDFPINSFSDFVDMF